MEALFDPGTTIDLYMLWKMGVFVTAWTGLLGYLLWLDNKNNQPPHTGTLVYTDEATIKRWNQKITYRRELRKAA